MNDRVEVESQDRGLREAARRALACYQLHPLSTSKDWAQTMDALQAALAAPAEPAAPTPAQPEAGTGDAVERAGRAAYERFMVVAAHGKPLEREEAWDLIPSARRNDWMDAAEAALAVAREGCYTLEQIEKALELLWTHVKNESCLSQESLVKHVRQRLSAGTERVTVRERPDFPSIWQVLNGDIIIIEMLSELHANRYAAGLLTELRERSGR